MVIRNLAVNLTTQGFLTGSGLQQKDFVGEAKKLTEFVRDNIRYVKDIDGVETVHKPAALLQVGAGDCDDKAVLLAALLLSIGHTPQFIAVSFDPEQYCHVWVQDYLNGKWVDLETTEPLQFGSRIPTVGALGYLTQSI